MLSVMHVCEGVSEAQLSVLCAAPQQEQSCVPAPAARPWCPWEQGGCCGKGRLSCSVLGREGCAGKLMMGGVHLLQSPQVKLI